MINTPRTLTGWVIDDCFKCPFFALLRREIYDEVGGYGTEADRECTLGGDYPKECLIPDNCPLPKTGEPK
jgi:hypothetical protein